MLRSIFTSLLLGGSLLAWGPPQFTFINTTKATWTTTLSVVYNPLLSTPVAIHTMNLEPGQTLQVAGLQEEGLLAYQVEEETFWVGVHGTYTITLVNPTEIIIEEASSGIHQTMTEVWEILSELDGGDTYAQQTRGFFYGRTIKFRRKQAKKIPRKLRAIRHLPTYPEYKQAIEEYLLPYRALGNFQNHTGEEFLAALKSFWETVPPRYNSPLYLESFRILWGYAALGTFRTESHRDAASTLAENNQAFSRASHWITANLEALPQALAYLCLVDEYYGLFITDITTLHEPVLERLQGYSKHPQPLVAEYAQVLLYKLSQLKPGTIAPDFELVSYAGDTISLTNLRGKFVYLDFWFSRCSSCLEAMEQLKTDYPQYGDQIEFVSINGFDDFDRGKKIAYERDFIGIKLHAGRGHPILQEYNVTYYPIYYLISPEGTILYKPKGYYRKEYDMVMKYLQDWNP